MVSVRPGKQRKALFQAPLHVRQKLIAAHLAKPLIKQFGRRSLAIHKGDEIKVMRGKYKGMTGKISRVDLKRLAVYVEGIKRKKVAGQEVAVALKPSKLMITNPVLDDKWRKAIIERSMKRGAKQ
ncbi:MAG: 50S ribosomal protein L24 [Candidatus Aenigmatarchaeota archaeon]|nr:50S ribosomal protein L24 [Candidatus Aenigmarchaeota archaeon]